MAEAKTLVQEQKLPNEVVEKIISMMPFPNLFKARTLSTRWSCAFSSNPAARSFQYQVKTVSSKWDTYCPVYVNQDGWLMGYDHASERWQKMFTLSSFLRQAGTDRQIIRDATFDSLSGPLLCGLLGAPVSCCSEHGKYCGADIFVNNVITKDWKVLPLRHDMEKPDAVEICASGAGAYKVMVLTHPDPPELKEYLLRLITFQFYDSKENTWTMIEMKLRESLLLVYQDAAYSTSNDKFYVVYRDILRSLRTQFGAFQLMAYDLKNVSCSRIELKLPQLRHVNEAYVAGLVECEGDLMVVFVIDAMSYSYDSDEPSVPIDAKWNSLGPFPPSRLPACSVMILKIDLDNHQLIPLARGPPETIANAYCRRVMSHDGCIYLLSCKHKSPVVVYNVRNGEWRSLSAAFDAINDDFFLFQPGLDPFVAV